MNNFSRLAWKTVPSCLVLGPVSLGQGDNSQKCESPTEAVGGMGFGLVSLHMKCIFKGDFPVTAGNGLRVAGDNTEGLGEEMDRDPKRAGHGAY